MVLVHRPSKSGRRGFRPLTGIVPYQLLQEQGAVRLRPLMGMVHRKDGTYDGNVSFRPLAGIVQLL